MPQMKPLMWLNLYIFFLLTFFMILYCLYFLGGEYDFTLLSDMPKKKIIFNWLW